MIVDKFNKMRIPNHPAMSAAQVPFIIQQAKATQSSKVSSKVETLKEQMKGFQESIKRIEMMLSQQARKISQVKS